MTHISVTGEGPSFDVQVDDGDSATTHTVTVPAEVAATLGWPPGEDAALVRASFEFLLAREPATSILRRFSLEVIGSYFPEYAAEMRRRAPHGPPPG